MKHWILEGRELKEAGFIEWASWFQNNDRVVKQQELKNGLYVSTVFLGLDHSFGEGPPLLFETMVFPKKGDFTDMDTERYSTYEEAEKGHKKMVNKWKK